jgi:regulator of protease activity HflC (stomatin/prohibitin superfamily)
VALVIAGIAVVVFLIVWAVSGVRVVRPFERGIVERAGRYTATVDPGLHMMIPLVDTVRMVDTREQVLEVAATDVVTKDNVATAVDAAVFYAPTDAEKLVYSVANFTTALDTLAESRLRSVVGDLLLDEAMASRNTIGRALLDDLGEATDAWGVQVSRVEVQRFEPPAEIIAAMQELTRAERRRAALLTEADGERQAAIARAEGERQAKILEAEAEREALALKAEGDAAALRTTADGERYRREVQAAGQAEAIRLVYEAIHDGHATPDVLAGAHIEALRELATGSGTTVVMPCDGAALASALSGLRAGSAATAPHANDLPPPPCPG